MSDDSQPIFSSCALSKIAENFPDKSVEEILELYADAKLLPKKSKRRSIIKSRCLPHDRKWMESGFVGRYYKVTRCGIVFVVATPEIIITVFAL